MKRRFSRREKNALYADTDGKCANCGNPLDVGWHADHIHAYSRGGETHLTNGQALCPKCNLAKGAKMVHEGGLNLREFQQRFVSLAVQKAKDGQKILVADVHPGSGKTLACLAAADRLMQAGYIEQLVVFVPRRNLTAQFEQDWEDGRPLLPWVPIMRGVHHRPNVEPLLLDGADGYVTTYDSLISSPKMHLRQIQKRKTLVVFDEAQQLGVDYNGQQSTESAQWAEQVGNAATMIFVMSGTPTRADGSKLLFATYDSPDHNGFQRLLPDISSTYRDGVRDGYLRRFEATLHDGGATWADLLNGERKLTLSQMDNSVYQILTHEGYWQPLVDRFVERLAEIRVQVDRRLCGLIAATNQQHAKQIQQYIKRKHGYLRVLIAVSDDGDEAHENLRSFKEGRHDILVTVSMAYVGYDHKPISTILVLTSFRTDGYLRQLLARGLRMWKEVPPEKQALFAFVPDDPKMRQFIDHFRQESDWGFQERLRKEQENQGVGAGTGNQTLGYVVDAWMGEVRAMGIDPTGDLTPIEYQIAEQIRQRMNIPYPVTDLMTFVRMYQMQTVPAPVRSTHNNSGPRKTLTERIKDARDILENEARKCDSELDVPFGTTNKQLYRIFGGSVQNVSSLEEVQERLRIVLAWKQQGHYG